jgi:hypothetical protein
VVADHALYRGPGRRSGGADCACRPQSVDRAAVERRQAVAVEQGGWTPVAPSAIEFEPRYRLPDALDETGIGKVVRDFRASARLALDAGFRLVEVHAAHGYLLHEFLSPLSNRRDDRWGGGFDNRIRLLHAVLASVREVWPERYPLWLRISATDWADGGWGHRAEHCSCAHRRRAGRGPGGCVQRRLGGRRADRSRPRLPGAVRRAHPSRSGHRHRRRRHDHRATASRCGVSPKATPTWCCWRARCFGILISTARAQALGAKIEAPPQYRRAW